MRVALGASCGRIARELLLESVILGLAGGVHRAWASPTRCSGCSCFLAPANLPRLDEIGLDPPALLFTLVASLAAGLLLGLIPVLKYAGAARGHGPAQRRPLVEREPRAASRAQRARGRPGRAGARPARQLRAHDPLVPRPARRAAGVRAAGGGPDAADLDSRGAGEGRGGRGADAAGDPGQGRGASPE